MTQRWPVPAPVALVDSAMLNAPVRVPTHPVLLVPGWSDRARVLHPLREFLLREGWTTVWPLEFRDRYGSNVAHAAEVAAAIERLRGGPDGCVDIVAHSMGGLAVRRWLRDARRSAAVRRIIFLGTPHHGTWAAWLAWGDGGREMRPGSRFLRDLNAEPLPVDVRALTLRAPLDLRVLPGSSAVLPRVADARIRLATHRGLLRRRAAFARVREALLEAGR